MDIAQAAQRVQRSAAGEAYAQHEAQARVTASVLSGQTHAGMVCALKDPKTAGDAAKVAALVEKDFGISATPGKGTVTVSARQPRPRLGGRLVGRGAGGRHRPGRGHRGRRVRGRRGTIDLSEDARPLSLAHTVAASAASDLANRRTGRLGRAYGRDVSQAGATTTRPEPRSLTGDGDVHLQGNGSDAEQVEPHVGDVSVAAPRRAGQRLSRAESSLPVAPAVRRHGLLPRVPRRRRWGGRGARPPRPCITPPARSGLAQRSATGT